MPKFSKEEILKDLTDALNEASETIYENYNGDIIAVGLVGFRDAQMVFTGPLEVKSGTGLMLTVAAGAGKELKIITNEEFDMIIEIGKRFKSG